MPEILSAVEFQSPRLFLGRGPGRRIEEELSTLMPMTEIKHLRDGTRNPVVRSLPDALSAQPVILDEVDDRALIGHRVIHKVPPRPRRDQQKRQPRPIAATAQSRCAADAWQNHPAIAAALRSAESIRGTG